MTVYGDERKERLLGILDKERSKMGISRTPKTPALFREMVLDTHKTMPAESFGLGGEYATTNYGTYNFTTQQVNNHTFRPHTSDPLAGTSRRHNHHYINLNATDNGSTYHRNSQHNSGGMRGTASASRSMRGPGSTRRPARCPSADPIFRSVFQPSRAQAEACAPAVTRRGHVANSEWALLDTMEVTMYDEERTARAAKLRAIQAAQRKQLDSQVELHTTIAAKEAAVRAADDAVMLTSVAAHAKEEKVKAEARKAAALKVKQDMEAMLYQAQSQRARAAATKQAEEEAELLQALQEVEADKARKAAKVEVAKAQWLTTVADNEARIAARKVAAEHQRAVDEALMQESIRTLEKQAEAREAAARAFRANIEARASKAGIKVVEENNARLEREARLVVQYEEALEKEAAARDAAAAAKKEAARISLSTQRENYLAGKAAKAAAAAAETAALRAETEARYAADSAAEDARMAGVRARTRAHAAAVAGQIQDKEQRAILDDAAMTWRERQLNKRLIEQAERVVGVPRQLTVRLC